MSTSTTISSKLSSKRSKPVVKEALSLNEEENEDEEPVRKRSRRNEAQAAAKSTSKKPKDAQGRDSSKSDITAVRSDLGPVSGGKLNQPTRHGKKANGLNPSSGSSTVNNSTGERAKPVTCEQKLPSKAAQTSDEDNKTAEEEVKENEELEEDDEEDEKPEVAAKAREKVQSTLERQGKNPYPDWKSEEPVPYAALCTTFSLVELTTKRLIISAHCSLFLRQVLRLTPKDLLPIVQLMINKLAADYAGIELGIGESLIMKAIGESTGRSLAVIKADQNEIGDLGLVAAKSRSNQPTMFKPKALTVSGVLDGLMQIATVQGNGSQGRKVDGIKKLLSAADVAVSGRGSKGVDITKDKGGASEAKFIIRFLEGKLRLGLAEKTVLVALAHAMVIYETEKTGTKFPSSGQLAKGEAILKTVYRSVHVIY